MNKERSIFETANHIEDELPKVAIGAGISLVGMIVGGALQYLYHIVLAKFLGPSYLGLFVLGLTVISISGAVSKMGLDNGILRYVAMYRGVQDTARIKGTVIRALQLTALGSLIMGTLVFVSSKLIATSIFQKPQLADILFYLAISILFFPLMTLALSVCQAFYIAKYTALVQNMLLPGLNIILASFFFVLGWKVGGAVAGYVIATFIAFGVSLYFLRKTVPNLTKDTETVYETNKLLRYSLPLLIVSFIDFIILWTDTIMLGVFRSSAEVGIYSAAVKTSMLLILFLLSFNFIFAPVISDLYNRKELKKLENMFKTVTRWAFTLTLPVFLITVFWSKEIMGLFGKEFTIGYSSLVILSLGRIINAGVGSVGNILIMTGKTAITLFIAIIILIVNIILNWLLIPKYGILGAALATTISVTLYHLTRLFEVMHVFKIHPYSLKIYKPIIAGLISFGCLAVLSGSEPGFSRILWVSLLFIALYFISLRIAGLDSRDKEIISHLTSKIFGTRLLF